MTRLFGAVEAGGTNVVCAVGTASGHLVMTLESPTAEPHRTLDHAAAFFRPHDLAAIGLGWFGPIELRANHPEFGVVRRSPKEDWDGVDVVAPFAALGVPVGLTTDVGAAALAEGEWGAAVGLASHVYVTIGTGIGGALVRDGVVVTGAGHPEMGHVPVTRQAGDDFPGTCPFHGDCLEGLAAGPAIAGRWGIRGEDLGDDEGIEAARLVAWYLAQGLRAITYVAAPDRIVVGGGVAGLPGFMSELQSAVAASFSGYPGLDEHRPQEFVVAPALDDRAGVMGGLVIARSL